MKTLSLILLLSSFLIGCVSFQSNAGKVLSSTAITVDTAMQSWVKYMQIHGVTVEQDIKARAAYRQYQIVMKTALDAYAVLVKTGNQFVWTDASKQLATASSYLLSTISTNNLSGKVVIP